MQATIIETNLWTHTDTHRDMQTNTHTHTQTLTDIIIIIINSHPVLSHYDYSGILVKLHW